MTRPLELDPYVSDVGAVNPPGDSAATDGPATLELAARVHAEAMAGLDQEVCRLREQDIAAVLCDAPAVPLVAARRAELPGFLMSNFTWADIYAPYARAVGGEAHRLVAELRRAYRHATGLFGSSRPCNGLAAAGDQHRHGRQSGHIAVTNWRARSDETRAAGLSPHRTIWSEQPGLVAPGASLAARRPLRQL